MMYKKKPKPEKTAVKCTCGTKLSNWELLLGEFCQSCMMKRNGHNKTIKDVQNKSNLQRQFPYE